MAEKTEAEKAYDEAFAEWEAGLATKKQQWIDEGGSNLDWQRFITNEYQTQQAGWVEGYTYQYTLSPLEQYRADVAYFEGVLQQGYYEGAETLTRPDPAAYGLVDVNGQLLTQDQIAGKTRQEEMRAGGAVGGVTQPAPTEAPIGEIPTWESAYFEMLSGMEGSQAALRWYENMFGTVRTRFMGTQMQMPVGLSAEEREVWTGTQRAEWAKWVELQPEKLVQERAAMGFWARGERPQVFQPRIRTTQF